MDHIRILRRAWDVLRNYRVLWIFGFLLALTTAHGGGNGGGGGNNFRSGGNVNPNGNWKFPFPNLFPQPELTQSVINTLIGVGIGLVCFIVLLAVVFTIVRYVSETASIRMVDRFEASGEKVTFREGWRLGWTRAAFRLWLLDLLVGLGVFLLAVVLILIVGAPFLVWFSQGAALRVVGTVVGIGLGVLAILLLIVVAAALSLLGQFFHRAVVLENLGVMDGLRRGWAILRRRPGDGIIMGLILFGIGLLFAIVMIPVALMFLAVSAVAGGLPAVLAWWVTNLLAQSPTPVIVALVVGIPVFLLVLVLPLTFISGLMEVFNSSTWTLTYREMVALETTAQS